MALIDILKAQGATDADLEMMKPLLSNAKFAGALEAEITAKAEWERKAAEASGKLSEFESQRNQFEVQANDAKKRVQEYDDWYNNQVTPALTKVQQDAIHQAELRAGAEAKLAKAKELYGFDLPIDTPTVVTGGNANPAPPSQAVAPVKSDLPDMSKYVTSDDINRQADMVGQAIAQTQDLAYEHAQLFGNSKPINFTSLREKAVAEKRPIKEIWERELNVPARKLEIAASQEAERKAKWDAELAAARQEGFEKALSQSVNPMTREPVTSRFATSFTKRDTAAGKPWEASTGREQDRITKVITTLARSNA